MAIPTDTTNNSQVDPESTFTIRLNSTYQALERTKEPIDVSIAHRLKNDMDDLIMQHEDSDAVKVHWYTPESHYYFKNQYNAYRRNSRESDSSTSVQEILSLGYGITRHMLSDEQSWALERDLETLYPDQPDIQLAEAAFDILNYRESTFELRYNDPDIDKEQFMRFFAIRLATEPISYLEDLLNFQWKRNFQQDITTYTRFLKQVCGSYKKKLVSKVRCEAIKQWYIDLATHLSSGVVDNPTVSTPILESLPPVDKTVTPASVNAPSHSINLDESLSPVVIDEHSDPAPGKKKKEMTIPITVERTSTDKLTKLTQEVTAVLFMYLQKTNIVLADQAALLSRQSFGKAIQVLTGYSYHSTVDTLQKAQQERAIKIKTKKALQEIIALIDKELDIKNPSN